MKRLIAAVVLAVIVTAVHFSGNIYIKKVIKESNQMVENCISDYKKDVSPKVHAEKLQKYWSDNEDYLSIFAHHDNIDESELAIDTLAGYAEGQRDIL